MFSLYRNLEPGEKIVIGGDPSGGGKDYAAGQAYSTRHRDFPMVLHGRMEAPQFGHELYKMALFIQKMTGEWPLIAVERNIGIGTIYVLQEYNYPNLFRMPKVGDSEKSVTEEEAKIGWHTNTATRIMMIDSFGMAMRQRTIKVYSMPTVKEMITFVVKPSGKAEAANGSFDDLLIAACIAYKSAEMSPKSRTQTKEQMMAKIAQFPKQDLFDDTGSPNV